MAKGLKTCLMGLALLLAAAQAEALTIGNYKLSLSQDWNPHLVGARDLHNGTWLTGTSVEVLWWVRRGEEKPIGYLAANHLYELGDAAKGSVGATLGLNTGKLGETIARVAPLLLPEQSRRLKWITTLGNYASIELGGGYRALGPEPSGSRWYYTLGGRVKIPLDILWKKKEE